LGHLVSLLPPPLFVFFTSVITHGIVCSVSEEAVAEGTISIPSQRNQIV
jgi:hypothetical protein